MKRLVVVGGGIMGAGIAQALLHPAHFVTVVEPDESRRKTLAEVLEQAAVSGPKSGWAVASDIDPVAVADLVIEAAPEDLALKQQLWSRLGRTASNDTILATNTSSLDVDLLAECVSHPSRVLATHWFNPAYEVECVEVAPARATHASVMEEVLTILRAVGKRPVVVRNSVGFVANRIQFAAIREALLCITEGVPARDVDEIVRTSFAPRLAALGPLANADLGGLDTYSAIFDVLSAAHGDRFSAPAILSELVAQGRFGIKSGAGISEYTPSSARALVSLRDSRLSRIIAIMHDEDSSDV